MCEKFDYFAKPQSFRTFSVFVVSIYAIIFIATLTFISSESFHLIIFTEQELGDLKSSNLKSFRDIQVDDSNILSWTGLIIPVRK